MMRLIDADVLKNHIKAVIQKQNGKNIDLIPVGELMVFIDNEPTVYDPDKVVQQIKELSIRERGEIKTEDVIAIVKGGGIDAKANS